MHWDKKQGKPSFALQIKKRTSAIEIEGTKARKDSRSPAQAGVEKAIRKKLGAKEKSMVNV